MYKLPKTGIEYADRSWNFYPGCLHKPQGKCPVTACWAEGMWKRQMGAAAAKGITLPDFHHPHLIPERLLSPLSVKKPSRILVNFMGDLFGDWVEPTSMVNQRLEYKDKCSGYITDPDWSLKFVIFDVIKYCPQHSFIFLTKNPAGLAAWSPFPDNCWVGVSATNWMQFSNAVGYLAPVQLKAKVKFISFEPLLERIQFDMMQELLFRSTINWLIIGQQTPVKASTTPKTSWIQDILVAAFNAGNIPVFIKDNLSPLLEREWPGWTIRQEFPLT